MEEHPCCPHRVAPPGLQRSGSPSLHMLLPPLSSEDHLTWPVISQDHQDHQEL